MARMGWCMSVCPYIGEKLWMLFSARVMKLPNMCITPVDNNDADCTHQNMVCSRRRVHTYNTLHHGGVSDLSLNKPLSFSLSPRSCPPVLRRSQKVMPSISYSCGRLA